MNWPAALQPDAAADVAAALPDCLANAAARARVAALARCWPVGAAGQILELRLDGRSGAVDISQAFLPPALADLHGFAQRHPELARLSACLSWAAGAGQPRSLWLEWDLAETGAPDAAALPSLFLAPPLPAAADPAAFFGQALHLLNLGDLVPRLSEILQILPPGTSLRQLGVMLPRPERLVRLVLDTGGQAGAKAVVENLCPKHGTALARLFAIPGFAQAPRLDLDLTPNGIGPRLSLELPSLALSPAAMAEALGGLAAVGVIDAGAARALTRLAVWRRIDDRCTSGLSHLKASAEPGGRIEVKAYLGLVAQAEVVFA